MKYSSILSSRAGERRQYTAPFDYHGLIQQAYDQLDYKHPQSVEGAPPERIGNHIEASDFWMKGDSGHADLGLKLGLELPPDFLDFSKHFKNYTLVCRNIINLLDADDVEAITLGLREGEDISLESPHRIYRFAQKAGEPSHFMFRWNDDATFRDVAFARYTDSTERDLLGEGSALFSCDASFSEWLHRMVETDAVPLHPIVGDEFDRLVQRVEASP